MNYNREYNRISQSTSHTFSKDKLQNIHEPSSIEWNHDIEYNIHKMIVPIQKFSDTAMLRNKIYQGTRLKSIYIWNIFLDEQTWQEDDKLRLVTLHQELDSGKRSCT